MRFHDLGLVGGVCLFLGAACAPAASPPAAPAAGALAPPASGPCREAAERRARVAPLLQKGQLERAVGAMDEANRLCPTSAGETWVAELATLVELGRYVEARNLANDLGARAAAPAPARTAAAAALKEMERLDRTFPDTSEATAEMYRLLGEADELAARSADPAALRASVERYLAAWEAWRPNPRALVGAGLAARALGDEARAQRLLDRALAELPAAPVVEAERPLYGSAWNVTSTRDGRLVAAIHAKDPHETYVTGITILDTHTLREQVRLRGHGDTVAAIAVSPDGRVLVSGARDRTARLWDTRTGAVLRVLDGHQIDVPAVSIASDGQRFVTGSHDGVRLWDLAAGALLGRVPGSTSAVVFSPDGKLIAAGSDGKKVLLADGLTGALRQELPWDASWVRVLAFTPDGARLAAASYDDARVWDTVTGAVLGTLKKPGTIFTVALSPDGARLVTMGQDAVKLWDGRTGALVATLKGRELAFAPDGKSFALGTADGVELRDAATLAVRKTYPGNRGWFLPDGRLLTAAYRGPLQSWDPATGALLATAVEGERDLVEAVAFAPDGKHLAAAGNDGTVRRWDLAAGALLAPLVGGEPRQRLGGAPPGGPHRAGAGGGVLAGREAPGVGRQGEPRPPLGRGDRQAAGGPRRGGLAERGGVLAGRAAAGGGRQGRHPLGRGRGEARQDPPGPHRLGAGGGLLRRRQARRVGRVRRRRRALPRRGRGHPGDDARRRRRGRRLRARRRGPRRAAGRARLRRPIAPGLQRRAAGLPLRALRGPGPRRGAVRQAPRRRAAGARAVAGRRAAALRGEGGGRGALRGRPRARRGVPSEARGATPPRPAWPCRSRSPTPPAAGWPRSSPAASPRCGARAAAARPGRR
jgi:WD40 repeat protein